MHGPCISPCKQASYGAYEWAVSIDYLLEAFGMHNHVRQPPVDEIELSNFELAAARRGTDPSASLGAGLLGNGLEAAHGSTLLSWPPASSL